MFEKICFSEVEGKFQLRSIRSKVQIQTQSYFCSKNISIFEKENTDLFHFEPRRVDLQNLRAASNLNGSKQLAQQKRQSP